MSDPFSPVLAILRPRSAISIGLDLAGDWSFHFPRHDGIKFNAVLRGTCWLKLQGENEWQRLNEGDCFLMTRGLPFQLASDPALPALDANILYGASKASVIHYNGGGELLLVGGRFLLSKIEGEALLSALPAVQVVNQTSPHARVLGWALRQLAEELDEGRVGSAIVAEHLAHVMLVHIIRVFMAEGRLAAPGWLSALGDRQLGRAISAMHNEPGRRWSLSELANVAAMSRTKFATKFKKAVGQGAISYLTGWRMMVACERLKNSSLSISEIAAEVGYDSEAAFSSAFKRILGAPPRKYARRSNLH